LRESGGLMPVMDRMAHHVRNALRQWRNSRRYGVKSSFMFRNVELEINSMCNRTCWYCPNVSSKRPHGYMEQALFEKIIAELADMDFDGAVSYHFYGEPLLDKRLLGFVEYTARQVPRCRPVIYSNGDFLTLDLFRQYIQAGVSIFWITQHDNSIPPHLRQILDEATAEEKRHIDIHFANTIQITNRSGLITSLKAPAEPLCVPCDWPLATMVITMSGAVVPCCNDYHETEVIGEVRTRSLRAVWCDDRFERFRRALSKGDRTASGLCASCSYVPGESSLRGLVPG
jgi:radical SAM protein with 4Fe4S-binding SPASM domain